MSRIVIVARTRMHGGHLCIGGHDLGRRFRGVRLLDRFGDHWPSDSPFLVGELWDMHYLEKGSARPPHVEDVCVMEYRRMGQIEDLKGLVLKPSSIAVCLPVVGATCARPGHSDAWRVTGERRSTTGCRG